METMVKLSVVGTHVPIDRWLADLSIESDGGDYTVNRGTTPKTRAFIYPPNSFLPLPGRSPRALGDREMIVVPAGGLGPVPIRRRRKDLLRRGRAEVRVCAPVPLFGGVEMKISSSET
jgi:hypothetical protein